MLTIGTVNFNSADLIAEILRAVDLLTVSEWKMVVCDNGSKTSDINKLEKAVRCYSNVSLIKRKQTEIGSHGHAEGLNVLRKYFNTRYGVLLDSDCIPLAYGWDELLIRRLSSSIKIVGTPVASNSPGMIKRDKSFPLMFLCLIDNVAVPITKIDFKPGDITKGQDTGWKMREIFQNLGYDGYCLHGENTRSYRSGPLSNSICDEYYLDSTKKRLICSHFGRGSNPVSGKYRDSQSSYLSDKDRWLRRCGHIIDSQVNWATTERHVENSVMSRCPFCFNENFKQIFVARDELHSTLGVWYVVQCENCDLVLTNPRPSSDRLAHFYPTEYAPFHAPKKSIISQKRAWKTSLRRQVLRQHFGYFPDRVKKSWFWWLLTLAFRRLYREHLLPRFPSENQSRRLLEIGSGNGSRLVYLRSLGWEVRGNEVNVAAANRINKLGVNCSGTRFEELNFPKHSFDAVVLSMVLEHLADPVQALFRIREWLKPGGQILISVPLFDGFEARLFKQHAYTLQVPTHLTHFTNKTIENVLNHAGFKIKSKTHQIFFRDLKAGAEIYFSDSKYRHLVGKLPRVIFKSISLLLGLAGKSSRISIRAVVKTGGRPQ